MKPARRGAAARLILSLATGAVLSGCAVYAPPYAAYDPAPLAASYYAYSTPYPYHSPYYYPYGYARQGYAGPPLSLDFGYYGYRHGGNHGWGATPGWRGHGWNRGGVGGYRGGGRAFGGGRGGFSGGRGGFGAGRGGFHGGGRGHR
ncbi:hypothetical protein HH212_14120 [Massilia forsythiae]|uniref:Lipoprotein n=1 Tax=Massilia forsythiae TaxID=2728020 RepID=A0A7Z2VY32_9BURK|nr:hypothetical protein [Massilia forsythiae]QJE01025.1 hypothetical protein HH212_14120 [Massilia forsythiae]